MGRQIRLSANEAIAAGLLDPEIAKFVKPIEKAKGKGKKTPSTKKSKAAEAGTEKPKRRRSVSRPAVHPKHSAGPAGHGQYNLGSDGKVWSADLVFDLIPVPKERPRVVRNAATDQTFGFTPARTKYFTVEVERVVRSVFGSKDPIEGPVRLDMTFVMQVPKSWPKWKREAALSGLIVPTSRPDMDNLEKALLDAFNETLFVDDAFVIERLAKKVYGEMPQIMTRVEKTLQCGVNVKRETVEELKRFIASSNSNK